MFKLGKKAVDDPYNLETCARAGLAMREVRALMRNDWNEMMERAEANEPISVEDRVAYRANAGAATDRMVKALDPKDHPARILDLGPTSGANITFWGERGFKVSCYDLERHEMEELEKQPITNLSLAADRLTQRRVGVVQRAAQHGAVPGKAHPGSLGQALHARAKQRQLKHKPVVSETCVRHSLMHALCQLQFPGTAYRCCGGRFR